MRSPLRFGIAAIVIFAVGWEAGWLQRKWSNLEIPAAIDPPAAPSLLVLDQLENYKPLPPDSCAAILTGKHRGIVYYRMEPDTDRIFTLWNEADGTHVEWKFVPATERHLIEALDLRQLRETLSMEFSEFSSTRWPICVPDVSPAGGR